MKIKFRMPLKLRLLLPLTLIIVTVIALVTLWFVRSSISTFNQQLETTLQLEVKTITKMFERERVLKLENVESNLRVANNHFYASPLQIPEETVSAEIENQDTGEKHIATLNQWQHNGYLLHESNAFVDRLADLIGGTVTVFQQVDSGFVRISTNVRRPDGERATYTYIPNDSPVAESMMKGETYFGRAVVVDEWYITAYDPIIINDEVVGMLYVGDREKDMEELNRILQELRIGESGYPFVVDKSGQILIHPSMEGEDWSDTEVFDQMHSHTEGTFHYQQDGEKHTLAFNYFEPFELYIAASIFEEAENRDIVRGAIRGAIMVALLAIIFLLAFIYRFTTDRIYRYFTALKESEEKLASAQSALKQSQKLASMGQIAAGIAHELNNPLGVITMYSNIVLDELDKDDPKREDMELIVQQVDRCKNIVGGLLNFARKNRVKADEVDIIDFLEKSLRSVVVPESVKVSIEEDLTDHRTMVDTEQMVQVFTNLAKNAIDAMPEGGTLTISVKGDEENVYIEFSDQGTGIPEEHMDKLFTPFFTTKKAGKGTGLGLSLVYGIIKMHHGKIEARSNTDPEKGPTGTTFKIKLPREPK
ncbi:MAG: Cache 3/Cache 2 fusion domain-containing protein [Bacteroidales bacterium]